MSKLLATTIALGLATASVAPAFAAADKAPTTKSECQKEHMKWDASTKTCAPKGGGY
jgi:hypothetical protein